MGPIYMNEVKCLGQEKSIWNCPFKNITSEDCQHTEDAAVRCNIPYLGLENSVRAETPSSNILSDIIMCHISEEHETFLVIFCSVVLLIPSVFCCSGS